MKALSLFGVLILAHLLSLLGRHISFSAWMPIAFFWQDVLVALLFAFVDFCLKRSRAGWILYAAMVVYVAINVPVTRVLSTPLTLPMLRPPEPVARFHRLLSLRSTSEPSFWFLRLSWFPLLLSRASCDSPPMVIVGLRLWRSAGGCIEGRRSGCIAMHLVRSSALVFRCIPGGPKSDWRKVHFLGRTTGNFAHHGAAAGRNVVLVLLESTASGTCVCGAAEDPTPNLTGSDLSPWF